MQSIISAVSSDPTPHMHIWNLTLHDGGPGDSLKRALDLQAQEKALVYYPQGRGSQPGDLQT